MQITDIWHNVFLNNSVRSWVVALSTTAGLFVVFLLAKRLVVARFTKVAEGTRNRVDDMIVATFAKTRNWAILAFAIIVGFGSLSLPYGGRFFGPAAKLILLWQIAVWGSAAITFWVKHHLDNRAGAGAAASVAMITTMGVGASVLLWILVTITAFHTVLGIDVTPWITGLGVTGIAVALAVQNILGDLLAALAIVFDKPFDVGDQIGIDDITGTVEQIGLKTTRIRSVTGEQIVIGNGDLLKARLRNYKRMYQRRVLFVTDLAVETPPDVLAGLPAAFEKIVNTQTPVRFDRSHVASVSETGIHIETVYFVLDPDFKKYRDIHQAINLEILRTLRAAGVALATTSSVSILRRPLSTGQ